MKQKHIDLQMMYDFAISQEDQTGAISIFATDSWLTARIACQLTHLDKGSKTVFAESSWKNVDIFGGGRERTTLSIDDRYFRIMSDYVLEEYGVENMVVRSSEKYSSVHPAELPSELNGLYTYAKLAEILKKHL